MPYTSLWGGCSQPLFCVSYRPCFEECPRIWYFAGLSILQRACGPELKQSLGLKSACKEPPNGFKGAPSQQLRGLRLTIQHSQASEAFWQLAGLRIASQLAAHVGLMWTHLALMWAHLALMWTHLALMWTHLALVWTHLRFLATRGPTNRFLATRRPTNRFLVARRPTKSLPRLIWHSCVEPSGGALTALMKHQLRYGTCCTTCSTTGNTTKRVGCDQFLSYHV